MIVFRKLCRTTWSLRVNRTESVSVMVGGSEFLSVGSETVKLPCPYLIVLEHDSVRSRCVAEQSCLRQIDADNSVGTYLVVQA